MWDEDLFIYMYKFKESKAKKTKSKSKKSPSKELSSKRKRLSLEKRDPSGVELFKSKSNPMAWLGRAPKLFLFIEIAEQYFAKVILPVNKAEHEQKRQVLIAAVNTGKSTDAIPTPYNKDNECNDKMKFVTLKLASLNDWGNDAYKRPK